jgi:NAD(P)-dependent dehydrogenase (short-subunit alcohol dehydrogenase family)
MELTGRVAMVTGGAVRVGRALAVGLARAGADVFIHYNRSAGHAEEVAGEIADLGRRAAIGSVDLMDTARLPELMAMATEAMGPVSILVNAASNFPEDTLADVTVDGWRDTQAVTLLAPVFLTQAFAATLPEDMDAAVVNITDVKTLTPYRKRFSYMMAKGGLDTFTRAAALALAPRIRVNAVALGVILPPPGEGEDYVLALAENLPLQRVGGTDPVVAAVVALLQNDFITGEIVRIDGGGHLT